MNTAKAGEFSMRATWLAVAGCLSVVPAALAGQAPAPAPTITTLTTVPVTQRGNPPTGPMAVIVEHDPGLPTQTIYRPRDLGATRHPVVVWGEGGCAKNGLMFPEFLSELASHGFVIIADGPPGNPGAGAGGPGPAGGAGAAGPPRAGAGGGGAGGPGAGARPAGPPPAAAGAGPAAGGGARAGGAPAGGGAGGVPRIGGASADGTDLIKGLDWLEREASRAGSRFQNKVDTTRVAAMGMSCGGLMSYAASSDKRVVTVGIWNSGLVQPDEKIYNGLHGSVILVTGGESDVAYPNAKRDFDSIPARIPVFYGVYPSVGHGGTYNEDNGGAYGVAALAWLKWQLQGDTSAKGRGFFTGDNCVVCKDEKWTVKSRAL
jgi:hypothetical protein